MDGNTTATTEDYSKSRMFSRHCDGTYQTQCCKRLQYGYEEANDVMTPMRGLKVAGLNTIATSDYDTTTIENSLNEFLLLWTTTDISTY